jgi:hypothetical protein
MALNLNSGCSQLFRTYKTTTESTYDCEIWEAARATSAAPGLFNQILIGGHGFPKQPYIDGSIGLNNPIRQVLEECHTIFPGQSVACIISVGTGQKSTIQIPNPSFGQRMTGKYFLDYTAKATMDVATDCEATEELISKQFQRVSKFYYRFNVNQGMQSIDASDFEKVQNITAHSMTYIKNENVHAKLKEAVLVLCAKQTTIQTSQLGMILFHIQMKANNHCI